MLSVKNSICKLLFSVPLRLCVMLIHNLNSATKISAIRAMFLPAVYSENTYTKKVVFINQALAWLRH
jgi:hypothetical protein